MVLLVVIKEGDVDVGIGGVLNKLLFVVEVGVDPLGIIPVFISCGIWFALDDDDWNCARCWENGECGPPPVGCFEEDDVVPDVVVDIMP